MSPIRKEVVIGDCRLILGDMRAVVPTLGTFDLCLTDPPYGIDENDKKVASRANLAAPKDYGSFDWDKSPADAEQMDLVRASSQHQIVFGGNYFDLPKAPRWLVWDKENSGDFADGEMAWCSIPGALRIFRWQWNGFIRKGEMDKVKTPSFRAHPTQKPVALMEWCLGIARTARSVVDPFMGSGTTGIACAKRGLSFTGVELHEPYFDIACERIRKAYAQPDMFVSAREPAPVQQPLFGDVA